MELFNVETFVKMANQVLPENQQVTVRNLRKLIADGVLSPAFRQGREAFYTKAHLDELINLRSLMKQGFKVSAIEKLKKMTSTGSVGDFVETSSFDLIKSDLVEKPGNSAQERQDLALDFIKKMKSENLASRGGVNPSTMSGLIDLGGKHCNVSNVVTGGFKPDLSSVHQPPASLNALLGSASSIYQRDLIGKSSTLSESFLGIKDEKKSGNQASESEGFIKGKFGSIKTEVGVLSLQLDERQFAIYKSLSEAKRVEILNETIVKLFKLID